MVANDIKISIIIKTCNSGATLVNTLESINSFGEIIALDNHSTDDTLDILKEYRVKIVFSDKNNITTSLNQVLDEAQGDWIFILEDDEIAPKNLLDALENYVSNPKKNRDILSFTIKTFYLGKEVKSAKEKNIIRFFKKESCIFKDNNLFELKPIKGKILKFNKNNKLKNGYILKYVQNDISRFFSIVLEKNKNKLKFSNRITGSVILSPIFEFFKYYIFKLGIFEGLRGLIFARKKAIEKFILETMFLEKSYKTRENNNDL